MQKLKFFLILVYLIFLGACATKKGVFLEESNYSVKQHRVAITQALGRVREVSRNGRVITSEYHNDKFDTIKINNKTRERLSTKVSILGSKRPYRVQIEVLVEKRDPETQEFVLVDFDEDLSIQRAGEIKKLLNQSRSELTTFDEQNPF